VNTDLESDIMLFKFKILVLLFVFILNASGDRLGSLDLHYDGETSTNKATFTGSATWQHQNFDARFNLDKSAKTLDAGVKINNQNKLELQGTYSIDDKLVKVKAYLRSKFQTGDVKLEIKKLDAAVKMYLITYLLPDGTEGKLTARIHANSIKLVLRPKNSPEYKLSGELAESGNQISLKLDGEAGNRRLNGTLNADKHNKRRLTGKLDVTQDAENLFGIFLNTKQFPYELEIAPASRAGIPIKQGFSSDKFFIEADYKPDNYLHINTNSRNFTSINMDKMHNDLSRFALNGRELFQGAMIWNGFKSLESSFTLADGGQGKSSMSLASQSFKQNEVNIEMALDKTLQASAKWDLNRLHNLKLNAEVNVN